MIQTSVYILNVFYCFKNVRVTSMSCSDKIARWNVLGLQGVSLAKFIKPIYLESIVLGSSFIPIHFHRAIIGRLENGVIDLPVGYCMNKPKFESTSLMEIVNSGATEDYGICWNDGNGQAYAPEIINLQNGLTISGQMSKVSKLSFENLFKTIKQKLPDRSDKGIEEFNTVKKTFYAALEQKKFGVWEKKIEEKLT